LLDEASTERMSLENLVAECLEHLGFYIQHQAQTGKPEGIATADLAPDAEERGRRYRFIYEAKSTTAADRKVSTKDVNVSGQDRHRRHAARDTDDEVEVQHALVVAPGFQSGALKDECGALNVCPMRTSDLGRLIVGAAVSGPLDQERFRRVLEQGDPDDVAREVTALIEEARKRTTLTIAELVDALDNVDNVSCASDDVSRTVRATPAPTRTTFVSCSAVFSASPRQPCRLSAIKSFWAQAPASSRRPSAHRPPLFLSRFGSSSTAWRSPRSVPSAADARRRCEAAVAGATAACGILCRTGYCMGRDARRLLRAVTSRLGASLERRSVALFGRPETFAPG
jgi:hypothetical protein